MIPDYGDKPYYSLSRYYHQQFGTKVYKLSINAGFTCPNRDGTLGIRGCSFCSAGGSGEFAGKKQDSIKDQIAYEKKLLFPKLKHIKEISYIAYFQAYTNTYAPLTELKQVYEAALSQPQIVGLSIATRPDCIADDVAAYLKKLATRTYVSVELGLQTISEEIASHIRRGYPLSIFEDAITRLSNANIHLVVHLIIGLPGETKELLYDTIHYLNQLPINGIKFSLLHILKGSDMEQEYMLHKEHFPEYDPQSYAQLITDLIRRLRPDIVVHRMTGDGPKSLLVAPAWSANKRQVLNTISKTMKDTGMTQGDMKKEIEYGK